MAGETRWQRAAELAEPVVYVGIGMIALTIVTAILQKAGVPAPILAWAALVLVVAAIIVPANLKMPSRLAAYVCFGHAVSPTLNGLAQAMILLPAGMGIAYLAPSQSGLQLAGVAAGLAGGLLVSAVLFGGALNRSGAYSLPEFLQARFGSRTLDMLVLAALTIPQFALLCLQLWAFALLAENLFGIAHAGGVTASLVLACLLVLFAGYRGVVISAVVGFLVLFVSMQTLYWGSDAGGGTLPAAETALTDLIGAVIPFLAPGEPPPGWLAVGAHMLVLAGGFSVLAVVARTHTAVASGEAVQRSAAMALIFLAVAGVVWMALSGSDTGLSALIAGMDETVDIAGFLVAIGLLLSLAILTGALLSSLSAMIANDGYRGLVARHASENARLIATRMVTVLTAAAAYWIALEWPAVLGAVAIWGLALAMAAVFPAMVAAVWWRRCTAVAALSGAIAGAAIVLLWLAGVVMDVEFFTQMVFSPAPASGAGWKAVAPTVPAALAGAAVNAAGIIVVTLFGDVPQKSGDAFFRSVHDRDGERPLNGTSL